MGWGICSIGVSRVCEWRWGWSCALGYDTAWLDGQFQMFWRNVVPLKCWEPLTQWHSVVLQKTWIAKVHAALAGQREALLSSVSSPDYLGFHDFEILHPPILATCKIFSRMALCLITAWLLVMQWMKCSLWIGLGGDTQSFGLQGDFLLTL